MFRAEETGGPDILLEQFLRAASTLGIHLLMLAFPKKQTTKKECLFQEDQLLLITRGKTESKYLTKPIAFHHFL